MVELAESFAPEFLLAFKAPHLEGAVLRHLRGAGVRLYNYYPDTSAFSHGGLIETSLPEYDCVFYTKRFWVDDVRKRTTLRDAVYLPHGYDPEVHRPWELSRQDVGRFGHAVGLIATYTPYKEHVMGELIARMPKLDLWIWGNQWRDRCRSEAVRRHLRGSGLTGSSYAKALNATKVNLGVMSGVVEGASRGDATTTRTYEIPACGGFMLHERSDELLELYEEGAEVACFGSPEELAEKVAYYLANSSEREAIARAGHRRCVPAYSYDHRMRDILDWHRRRGRAAGE